jgi:hypothetical protein
MDYDKERVDADIREMADVIRYAEAQGYGVDAREALFRLKTIIREQREALKEK